MFAGTLAHIVMLQYSLSEAWRSSCLQRLITFCNMTCQPTTCEAADVSQVAPATFVTCLLQLREGASLTNVEGGDASQHALATALETACRHELVI